MRHPGARPPAAALRRVRPRQVAALQLQVARALPLVRRVAQVADGSAPGRTRHPARAGAPVGAVAADHAARAAGRAARAGHAGAAGGAACGHAAAAVSRRAQGRCRPGRRRHADPALRLGRQLEHPPALPGAGRRVPLRRRWRARLHRGGCADRRHPTRAAAHPHCPAHEAAHAPGRAGRGHGSDLPGRARYRQRGVAHAAAAAGRGPRQTQTVHRTVCVRARLTALPSAPAPDRRC
jgi:hypothetical protein